MWQISRGAPACKPFPASTFKCSARPPWSGVQFTPDDDRVPGAHPVAVLSYAFWTRRLDAAPEIVGQTITLAHQPFTIVGVERDGFFGEAVGREPEIWVPMTIHPAINPGPSLLADPRVGWLPLSDACSQGSRASRPKLHSRCFSID